MTLEDEIRKEIFDKFSERYNLKKIDVKVVLRDDVPKPDEFALQGAVLDFLGKFKNRFVYLVRKGWLVLEIICMLVALPELPDKLNLYVPKAYDFVINHTNNFIAGRYDSLRDPNHKEDGYLVLRQGWINDKKSFDLDNSDFHKGKFGSLYDDDAAYIPPSGSSAIVVDGTTSTYLWKFDTDSEV